MADIVLINPRFPPSYWGWNYALPLLGNKKAAMPSLNLPLLAALAGPQHAVTIIDENIEEIDFDRCEGADLVGVTGMFVQRARMREILSELKRRGIFAVLGGPWVSVDPADLSDLADVIFVGEAEETWPRFLAEWSEGRHARRYQQGETTDVTELPCPRLELLPMNKYLLGSVQLSRGCPFTCEFCDIIVIFGRRPRIKRAAQIIAELDALVRLGKHDVFIVDDNLVGNKKAIKPILREIIAWQKSRGYPLSFITQASIDLAEDEELMRLMVEANLEHVFIGVESTDEEALRETKKIQNLRDRRGTMLEKIHRVEERGMMVSCGMIVGFDADDQSVFEKQRRFVQEARVPMATVNVLTAIPQTPLYARLSQEGRLTDWDEGAPGNVIPLNMGKRELWDGHLNLLRSLYTAEAFFARLDAFCLETGWLPAAGRTRYLLRHEPGRWLKLRLSAVAQAGVIYRRLMLRVRDPQLRRQYRRRLRRIIVRRPNARLFLTYCLFCALHFHYRTLIRQLIADTAQGPQLGRDAAPALPQPVAAISAR